MWLALVTDVDQETARNLVDSMNNEVVVQDDSITRLLPGELINYEDSVRLALKDRAAAEANSKPTATAGPQGAASEAQHDQDTAAR
jgi:hypothetical protein